MSDGAGANKPAGPPGPQQQYYPPPPPGPPPAQAGPQYPPPSQAQYQQPPSGPIPAYDPAHPHYAAPPADRPPRDDIYGSTPPEAHDFHQQQQHQQPASAQLDGKTSGSAPGAPGAPAGGLPVDQTATAAGHTTTAQGKQSWSDRLAGWGTKAAAPLNALANKMGSEAFLPTPMDKECEKAARILKAFCKDGIYDDPDGAGVTAVGHPPDAAVPTAQHDAKHHDAKHHDKTKKDDKAAAQHKKKDRVLLKIPPRVIARAQGLAIFTNMRAGFHMTGAMGSGVLLARLPDGGWSPPSGIQITSLGAGFVVGLGLDGCVIVINTPEALAAFTRSNRVSLGGDIAVTAGPWGMGGSMEWGLPNRPKSSGGSQGQKQPNLPVRPNEGVPLGAAPGAYTAGSEAQGPAGAAYAPGPGASPSAHFASPPAGAAASGGGGPVGDGSGGGAAAPAGLTTGQAHKRAPTPGGLRDTMTKPVYGYVKSRGFYVGVQFDGTVVTERRDANKDFYGAPVSVTQILRGEVPAAGPATTAAMWPAAARGLMEVLRGAESGWSGHSQPVSPVASTAGGHYGGPPGGPPPPSGGPAGYGHAGYGSAGNGPAGHDPAGYGPPTGPPGHTAAPGAADSYYAPGAGTAPGYGAPGSGVPGATAGMRDMNLGTSQQGTSAADAKAAEAAAESVRNNPASAESPPAYHGAHGTMSGAAGGEDHPPPYMDEGQTARPGVGDHKAPGGPQ